MKKKVRNIALVMTVAVAFTMMFAAADMNQVNAATSSSGITVRETDVSEPEIDNVIVETDGVFYAPSSAKVLKRLNAIRKEACERGYPNPNNPKKKLTSKDYTPLRWSRDLEGVAQTRAAEAGVYPAHERPNGKIWYSCEYNGVTSSAECLSFGYIYALNAIEGYYEEKEAWLSQNDNKQTGHYQIVIDPEMTYVGAAGYLLEGRSGTVAYEFRRAFKNNPSEARTNISGQVVQKMEIPWGKLIDFSHTAKTNLYIGRTKDLNVTAVAQYGKQYERSMTKVRLSGGSWSSTNEKVAMVSANGTVKPVSVGSAYISAKFGDRLYVTNVTVKNTDYESWRKCYVKNLRVSPGKGSITVNWGKQDKATRQKFTGYQIRYSRNANMSSSHIVTASKTTVSKKIDRLKKRRKYYVQMRSYFKDGDLKVNSSWTKAKAVTTR